MNDYLTAIAALEMTRPQARSAWTHRPYPRRRKRGGGPRVVALLRTAPVRLPIPATS